MILLQRCLFCMFSSLIVSLLYVFSVSLFCFCFFSVCWHCFSLLVSLFCSDWSLCLSASLYYSLSAFTPLYFSLPLLVVVCLSLSLYTVFVSLSLSFCPLNFFFFSMSLTCLSVSFCLPVFACSSSFCLCLSPGLLVSSDYASLHLTLYVFLFLLVPTSLILSFSSCLPLSFCFLSVRPLDLSLFCHRPSSACLSVASLLC